jgi:hypothetical protein
VVGEVVDVRQVLSPYHLAPYRQLEAGDELEQGSACYEKELEVFPSMTAAIPFGDVGWYGHRSPTYLIGEAEPLRRR